MFVIVKLNFGTQIIIDYYRYRYTQLYRSFIQFYHSASVNENITAQNSLLETVKKNICESAYFFVHETNTDKTVFFQVY